MTVRQHLGPVYTLAVSDNFLFTAGAEGVVRQWSMESLLNGESPCFEEECHDEPIWSMALNEKRGLLLTSSADQTLNLLKINGNSLESSWKAKIEDDTPTVVEWMGDNRFLSGFRSKQKIGVFDV